MGEHYTDYRQGDAWVTKEKKQFPTQAEADEAIANLIAGGSAERAGRPADWGFDSYVCSKCEAWHVGRRRRPKEANNAAANF